MIINPDDAVRTDSPYLPRTMRLALWERLSALQPHQSLHIERVVGYDLKIVQVTVSQVVPETWGRYFTRRDKDGLTIYRWS